MFKVKSLKSGILSQRNFLKLLCANFINRFGDSIEAIALSWLVFDMTKSAAWSATIIAFNYLPTVLLQFFVGPIVEKMNKRNTMAIADIIRACFTVILTVLYFMDELNPYILIVYTLVNSSVECFRLPSGTSIIPTILDKEFYDTGISLNQGLSTISEFIGLGIAGAVIACLGLEFTLIINAITFILSAIIIFTIKIKNIAVNIHEGDSYMEMLKEGIRYVFKNEIVLNICIFVIVFNCFTLLFETIQTPLAIQIFQGDSILLSLLGIGFSLGMLLSSIIYIKIAKLFKTKTIVAISAFFTGITYILFALVPGFLTSLIIKYITALLLSTIFGFFTGVKSVAIRSSLFKAVDKSYLSRTSALFNSMATIACPVMCFLYASLLNVISLNILLIITGVACIFTTLIIRYGNIKFNYED